ncbi:class III lanthionine synthetase LanKC [Streptosporangium fragile]|uniref:Class III lanthionine synthetase LanKC n=1 Tax=Streptosporangium fragile TaxID=46186 RepID=A0ABN3W6T0_9ACTN
MTELGAAVDGISRVDRHVLADIARATLRRVTDETGGAETEGVPGWEFKVGSPWTYVTPAGLATQAQGWKLHISATPLSAPLVLSRAAQVLGHRRCPFKYATTLDELVQLVGRSQGRGSVGKFITVYPPNDEAAVEIAEELHEATYGLPGPPILSDRVYRPGSLVHYRFGVFSAPSVLDNDGYYASRLIAPDGTHETDERKAWYSPPAWATCPFDSGRAPVRTTAPEAVLLADRFVVRRAIRHGAKGGVFLAEDTTTGAQVVIKRARPHLGAWLDGRDERDRMRHEARMLDLFGPLGVTARKVLLFEKDDNLFLAQEHIEGTVLSAWSNSAHRERPGTVVSLLRRLAGLVATVHGQGYVLRDLTPGNIVVTADGDCRLIDLEMAAVPGTPVSHVHTPGFAPPEQMNSTQYGPALGAEADLYALGATVLSAVTSSQPPHRKDQPAGSRSWDERVETVTRVASAGDPMATALSPLILGLMREDPAQRWDLRRVRAFLDEIDVEQVGSSSRTEGFRLGVAGQDRLLHDGLAYSLRTMSPGTDTAPSTHLWPSKSALTADPCAVQYGSAGVIALWATLVDPAQAGDVLPPETRADLTTGLRKAANWTVRQLARERRPSPGLYFGRAGVSVALYEAGRALGDEALRTAGLELALSLPTTWPNPDICHGSAGTGMALLHLWRVSGDTRLREPAEACADGLLKAAKRTPETVTWPIPVDFDSKLAGAEHYGFAHGVAGIAAYLLAAGTELGRDDCLETAVLAGETLVAAAEYQGEAAWWATGPRDGQKLPHWCSGSSGIGTYLVRLYAATGEQRFRDAAHGAAVTVHGTRRNSGTVACHGLAGEGQFLLDMADLLGEPAYHEQAEELAACLWARAVLRDGLLVVPDENDTGISIGWNTGLAGVLDFLHRLRHGGPRRWMAETDDDVRARGGRV